MKREEFLKELLENTKKEYEYFCGFQDILLHLFDITHKILKENAIPYYVAFGSLIGIMRDEGIVPWDYDYDLIVSIDDAKRVTRILEQNLPEDCYVVSNFNDKKFPYFQTRVCQKGFHHNLHVDIFYYFGLPDDEVKTVAMGKEMNQLFMMRSNRRSEFVHNDKKGLKYIAYRIAWLLRRTGYTLMPNWLIEKRINSLVTKYPVKSAKKVAAFVEILWPLKKLMLGIPQIYKFDGHEAMIPENWEGMLNDLYKNYKTCPKFITRFGEYQNGLRTLKEIDPTFVEEEKENYRVQ